MEAVKALEISHQNDERKRLEAETDYEHVKGVIDAVEHSRMRARIAIEHAQILEEIQNQK